MFQFPDRVSDRLADAIRDLLATRSGSICPSEAARRVGGAEWRALMEAARQAARTLARAGEVEITQRGQVLDPEAIWRGPVRIRIPRA